MQLRHVHSKDLMLDAVSVAHVHSTGRLVSSSLCYGLAVGVSSSFRRLIYSCQFRRRATRRDGMSFGSL